MSIQLNTEQPEVQLDLLADLVNSSHQGTAFEFGHYQGRWNFQVATSDNRGFHVVIEGEAFIRLKDGSVMKLAAGDIAFVAGSHELASDLTLKPKEFNQAVAVQHRVPQGNSDVSLLCGYYFIDEQNQYSVFSQLPDLVVIRAEQQDAAIKALVTLITHEFQNHRPGSRTVANRLIDSMLIYILRFAIAEGCPNSLQWLSALKHPGLAKVLALIHKEFSQPWTLDAFAQQAAMSRASLTRHFLEHVGTSPIQYLTEHRLRIAKEKLIHSKLPLDNIAQGVGYASGFALSKAFKRAFNLSPKEFKQQSQLTR